MSLSNPTREFLLDNFTKPQLQNHCKQLGITRGLHVKKEELIQLILDNHQRTSNDESTSDDEVTSVDISNVHIQKLISEFRDIKEKLAVKDVEIDDLYSKLQAANDTIKCLDEKVSSLERHVNADSEREGERDTNDGGSLTQTPRAPQRAVLLIGDGNLSHVKSSDLGRGCSIRTIKDADTYVFRSWLSKKLNWTPSECILYVGMADIQDSTSPSAILDNLSLLISDLKHLNSEMTINICKLVPVLISEDIQAKVNEYNDELVKWGQCNNINIISTDLPFKLGNCEIDDMCYETDGTSPGSVLNRLGAVRLLDSIAKLCPNFILCNDWFNMKRNHSMLNNNYSNNKQSRVNIHDNLRQGSHARVTPSSSNYQSGYDNQHHSNFRPFDYYSTSRTQPPLNIRNRNRYGNNDNDRQNFNARKRGCYNCGEFNHHYSSCRFDHQIRCTSCSAFGHKSRLCIFYRND